MQSISPARKSKIPLLLYLGLFALSILCMAKGVGPILPVTSLVYVFLYYAAGYRLEKHLPKKIIRYFLFTITATVAFFVNARPTYALFFDSLQEFLSNGLGTLIPGTEQFWNVFVYIMQFLFIVFLVFKAYQAFQERDNREEVIGIVRVPVVSLAFLAVLEFILEQVTSGVDGL